MAGPEGGDFNYIAGVAKLADATALGAVVPKGLVGSNPSARIAPCITPESFKESYA